VIELAQRCLDNGGPTVLTNMRNKPYNDDNTRVYAGFFKKGFHRGVDASVHTLRSHKWF